MVKNRTVAEDLKQAHTILVKVARCLVYPSADKKVTSQQVTEQIQD